MERRQSAAPRREVVAEAWEWIFDDDLLGPSLLFCSPAGAFVTGQVLMIDGGLTASQ